MLQKVEKKWAFMHGLTSPLKHPTMADNQQLTALTRSFIFITINTSPKILWVGCALINMATRRRGKATERATELEKVIRDSRLRISGLQETGRTLGKGSYGEVVEVRVNGRLCAAKKLHGIFSAQDVPPAEKSAMADRFAKECHRVLQLKHRNVVEMIGVHFDRATKQPALVMELLDTSLCSYLENNPSASVTITTKYDILLDVASGLVYLHTLSPPLGPLVHRDLTASNILLALGGKIVAKIADLGQAKNDPAYVAQKQKLSQVPGNEDHMPPEAWLDEPVYNASLDIFSFGVVMLHTLAHEWPKPLGRRLTVTEVRLEVDRRKPYLDKIDSSLLKPLVIECLSQKPEDRPVISEVFGALKMGKKCYLNIESLREAHTALNQHTESLLQQVDQLHTASIKDKQQVDSLLQQVDQLSMASVQNPKRHFYSPVPLKQSPSAKPTANKLPQSPVLLPTAVPGQSDCFPLKITSEYQATQREQPQASKEEQAQTYAIARAGERAKEKRKKIFREIKKIQPEAGKNLKDLRIPQSLYEQARSVAGEEAPQFRFTKVPVYGLLVDHIRYKYGEAAVGLTAAGPVLEGWKVASVALFRYALNLILAPKRAEFKKMKVC